MPAPKKEKLPYFSHESDARGDRNLKLYLANTGLAGAGFWWSILEEIYKNSYYLPFNEEDMLLFASDFSCMRYPLSIEDVDFFLGEALRRKLLDSQVYECCGVLTSPSIQRRYLKGCARRVLVELNEQYLLINLPEFYKNELSSSAVSLKIIDEFGDTVEILGNYEEPVNGQEKSNSQAEAEPDPEPEPSYDEKYNFDREYTWDGEQPIDYAGCVATWNAINGSSSRVSKSKREDLRRVFRNYTGKECMNAMIVRAKDEMMEGSKYLSQWSTLFGAKKLENLDKWVDRGREWLDTQNKLETVDDHIKEGWVTEKVYQDIATEQGLDIDDTIFCEIKEVQGSKLYYPKFEY